MAARDEGRRRAARAIAPARGPLDAVVTVPGSKSITNRALLLAALAGGRSTLDGVLVADDTVAFANGLAALGVEIDLDIAERRCDIVGAAGAPAGAATRADAARSAATPQVWCAEAGTAARFLVAACAAGHGRYDFDGAAQLRRRPLGALLDALRTQGARTEPPDAARLPFALQAAGLAGGALTLPGQVSSQFVSALLMAAPLARAPLDIVVSDLVSRPYVDMTCAMMADFGVAVGRDGHSRFRVASPAAYHGRDYAVEADASTASYFFAAAAVCGGQVTVRGLARATSLQGDLRFLGALERMGCRVADGPDGVTVAGPAAPPGDAAAMPAPLDGLTIDMSDFPDVFMTLAAVAPFARRPVTITGIANVRVKESDRIASVAENLRRLGIEVDSGPDWLRVAPGTPRGAGIDSHGDHRIAMSFAVIGLRVPGVVIEGAEAVSKTCPEFFELWRRLEGT
jgi:3-phosphoshikimate 1-carboxyvinyltransferase